MTDGLFRHTFVGVKAVTKVLAVLVGGVVGEHLAAGGALEGLEAGLALNRLCGRVLVSPSVIWPEIRHCNAKLPDRPNEHIHIPLSVGSLPPSVLHLPYDLSFAGLYHESVNVSLWWRFWYGGRSHTWLRYPFCNLVIVSR